MRGSERRADSSQENTTSTSSAFSHSAPYKTQLPKGRTRRHLSVFIPTRPLGSTPCWFFRAKPGRSVNHLGDPACTSFHSDDLGPASRTAGLKAPQVSQEVDCRAWCEWPPSLSVMELLCHSHRSGNHFLSSFWSLAVIWLRPHR